jgi:hypothetical protein
MGGLPLRTMGRLFQAGLGRISSNREVTNVNITVAAHEDVAIGLDFKLVYRLSKGSVFTGQVKCSKKHSRDTTKIVALAHLGQSFFKAVHHTIVTSVKRFYVPAWCNRSTSDFDSDGTGANPEAGAIFIAV